MARTILPARGVRRLLPLFAGVLCVAFMPHLAARTTSLAERFTAQSMSVSSADRTGPIEILIEEWSSDAELTRLRDALQTVDTAKVIDLLHQQKRRVGVVLLPGVGGHGARARTQTPHNLVFARAIETPSGRHVIAIADEHLGLGEPPLDARKQTPEFNLIDIRFGKDGVGVGKVITAKDVMFSAETKMLQAKDYAGQPVRLTDVKSETR